jgi:hypothetical protein
MIGIRENLSRPAGLRIGTTILSCTASLFASAARGPGSVSLVFSWTVHAEAGSLHQVAGEVAVISLPGRTF